MSPSTSCEPIAIGVGLDTARYGHRATFLREDRQVAAEPLEFLECRDGYQQLEEILTKLNQQHRNVHFHIRVDAASQYATNLLPFLQCRPKRCDCLALFPHCYAKVSVYWIAKHISPIWWVKRNAHRTRVALRQR